MQWEDSYGRTKEVPVGKYGIAAGVTFVVLVLLIGACNYATSFDAPRRGYAAVCQTGGPIEGDSGTCGVRPSGSGKSATGGLFNAFGNQLVEFPAQQRFWRTGGTPKGRDRFAYSLPTANGQRMSFDTLSRFTLNTSEKGLLSIYTNYGTRALVDDGPTAADDPDQWWKDFLVTQVDPIIERTAREQVQEYTCSDLNPACDTAKLNELLSNPKSGTELVDEEAGSEANRRLVQISDQVTKILVNDANNDGAEDEGRLDRELRGHFFDNFTFTVNKSLPPENLLRQIDEANAALATLVQRRASAQAAVADAEGKAAVRRENARAASYEKLQEAKGLRAISRAYRSSPEKARVDAVEALPDGLTTLIMGGKSANLLSVGK